MMEEKSTEEEEIMESYAVGKKRRIVLYALMLLMLVGFFAAELIYPSERSESAKLENITYQGKLTWQKPDGTQEVIKAPGTYDVGVDETMVITTRLPEDYSVNTLAIRSSLQDVSFYIDGELRTKYDTVSTRPFGKNSASRYVFCLTSEKDAGKEVRLELTTHTANYTGVVNTIYCGDRGDIWAQIFDQYGLETVMAFFILFAGLITVLFSIALGIAYHTRFDMEYLGWCMIVGAIWMISESKLRQLWVPNASIVASMCFVVVMLCPIPLLFYIDSVQKGKYGKLYRYIEGIAALNFVISTVLQLTGVADYIQTLPVAHGVLAISFVAIGGTFVKDIRSGAAREYHLVLIGMVITMISVGIEAASVYFVVTMSGVFIGIGLTALLFVNIIRTIKNVRDMEQNRQKQEIEKRRRQAEKMSLQMIQTLATTIEAKDEYMKGHSYRVAAYAALIAQELGWDATEISNLKDAVYMYDVGKIGIPDAILNKPTRLTEEEYERVKAHTVIGADILKNITIIDHVAEIARYHHERYDGHGYPDGLIGEDIPIHARIVAIADSYDAMNSRRIYRNSLPQEQIREEILMNRGKQFDPDIADVFLKLMDEGRLVIEENYPEIISQSGLSAAEIETGKFISKIMNTMKSQEDMESYDYLTGLPMRNRGENAIAQLMQQHRGCLVFMDMDNLKKINDIYGHKAGDRALKLLGNILKNDEDGSVACRLGGDEFLLFLPERNKEQSKEYVNRIFKEFKKETGKDVEIKAASLSAGLCMSKKGSSFEECYINADKALYYVKQNGKAGLFFYQQLQHKKIQEPGINKDLEAVAKALRESGSYSGALDLDYRDFAKIYEYMNSLGERYKHNCYLVMVTMDTLPEHVMYIESIEQALECMEKAIRQKIRKVDVCTRYSSMQYLIILFEPEESQIEKIMERIFMQYYKLYNKNLFKPRYEAIPMMDRKKKSV